jgi:hypothetical protein
MGVFLEARIPNPYFTIAKALKQLQLPLFSCTQREFPLNHQRFVFEALGFC